MRRSFLALVLFWPLVASADASRTIDHARLLLGDVVPSAPPGLAELDLGPAPPPGGTRVLGKEEIENQLRGHGVEPRKLAIPQRVSISTAARRIAPPELADLARPVIEKGLRPGVTLAALRPGYEVVVPPRAEIGAAILPKIPRQAGPFRTTATLELVCDHEVVARVPVPVTLDVSPEAAKPDVARGNRIDLVLTRGAVRITTQGSVIADANIGEAASAMVLATSRVVRVRITGPGEAEVLEGP